MGFVETVDGIGKSFSSHFVFDNWGQLVGGEMLVGNPDFEVWMINFLLLMDEHSEDGDFEDPHGTFFAFERLGFLLRSTAH